MLNITPSMATSVCRFFETRCVNAMPNSGFIFEHFQKLNNHSFYTILKVSNYETNLNFINFKTGVGKFHEHNAFFVPNISEANVRWQKHVAYYFCYLQGKTTKNE